MHKTSSVILARETTTTPSGVPGKNVEMKVLRSIPVNNNRARTTRKQRQRLNARRGAVAVAAADDDDDEKSSFKSASFRLILMRHSEAAEERLLSFFPKIMLNPVRLRRD